MDEDFLSQFRQAPRREFVDGLRERLKQVPSGPASPTRWSRPRWNAAWVALVVLVLSVVLLSFPSVRAAAQSFLDLFRIKRFAAVSVDPVRLSRLEEFPEGELSLQGLLAGAAEVLKEPGAPQKVDSFQAAAELAGIDVLVPTALPMGPTQPEIRVHGEGVVRFTADTEKLRELLELLGVIDVEVPPELDGATVTLRVPAAVISSYKSVTFAQAQSPEITLPVGVDLSQLGEIGLRIAGLPPEEARRFARSIDWRGTLLVPVPANVASFREVDVRDTKGLLITAGGERFAGGSPQLQRRGSILLWAEGDMVYGLKGGVSGVDLLEMANSLK